jgi:hypothetical protein
VKRYSSITVALLLVGCSDTRLLVTVMNDSVSPASLRFMQGTLADAKPKLVPLGSQTFPLQVRYYDLHTSPAVVIAEGLDAAGNVVSHGAVKAPLDSGRQVAATLSLSDGPSLDSDGDGVPDPVDDCPTVAGPCTPDLGGVTPAGKSSCDGRSWILCEGFDAPSLDPAWMTKDQGTGMGELDSIHPTRGTGELHLRLGAPPTGTTGTLSSAAERIRSFSPATTLYVRVFAYLNSPAADSDFTRIFDLTNTNAEDIYIATASGMLRSGAWSSLNMTSTQLVPTDRWTCLTWTIESDVAPNSSQHLVLNVDGTQVIDVTVPAAGLGLPSLVQLDLIADQMPGENARDLWLDDLVISSTPVSCAD